MTHLEGGRVLHGAELLRDRFGDFTPPVARVHAPEARDPVEDFTALVRPVIHALRSCEQARICLELSIRRERHPECVEIAVGGSRGKLCVHCGSLRYFCHRTAE